MDRDKPWSRVFVSIALLWALQAPPFCVVLGCSPSAMQVQIEAADVVGRLANVARETALDAQEQEGAALVARAQTLAEGEVLYVAWRDRWRRIWGLWNALRDLHATWSIALLAARDGSAVLDTAVRMLPDVKGAYCGLRGELPNTLPDWPMGGCGP